MRTNDNGYYTIYSYNMCLSFCDLYFIDVEKQFAKEISCGKSYGIHDDK